MKITDKEKKILFTLIQGMSKSELIDAIASSAELTKSDAGRALDTTIEQMKKLKVVFGGKGQ